MGTLLACLLVLVLIAPPMSTSDQLNDASPSSHQAPSGHAKEPSDDGARRVRAELGFTTSDSEFDALRGDPEAVERGRLLGGVPLSQEEAEELRARVAMSRAADPVVGAARDLSPETWAGDWIDQPNGQLVVAYTDHDPTRLDRIQAIAAHPDRIRVDTVATPRPNYKKLMSVFRRLS